MCCLVVGNNGNDDLGGKRRLSLTVVRTNVGEGVLPSVWYLPY